MKVWTLTTESDNCGMETSVHTTNESAQEELAKFFRASWPKGREYPKTAEGKEDHEAAWEWLTGHGGSLDSWAIEEHEIALPDDVLQLLRDLKEWENQTGGWDAPVWSRLAAFLDGRPSDPWSIRVHETMEAFGGPDGEHPEWDRAEWQRETSAGDTQRGYWDWVAAKEEEAELA